MLVAGATGFADATAGGGGMALGSGATGWKGLSFRSGSTTRCVPGSLSTASAVSWAVAGEAGETGGVERGAIGVIVAPLPDGGIVAPVGAIAPDPAGPSEAVGIESPVPGGGGEVTRRGPIIRTVFHAAILNTTATAELRAMTLFRSSGLTGVMVFPFVRT